MYPAAGFPPAEERLLHALLVGFDHLLDHLAADGAGLAGGQVTVVTVGQVHANFARSLHLEAVHSFTSLGNIDLVVVLHTDFSPFFLPRHRPEQEPQPMFEALFFGGFSTAIIVLPPFPKLLFVLFGKRKSMYLVKICSRICCAFTEATSHQATVSEELTSILEALFAEDIPAEQEERMPEEGRTNLVTTMEFAAIHGRSQEQIKQYLHQNGRLAGRRFGRDWVIVDDEKLPQDRRKREALT